MSVVGTKNDERLNIYDTYNNFNYTCAAGVCPSTVTSYTQHYFSSFPELKETRM